MVREQFFPPRPKREGEVQLPHVAKAARREVNQDDTGNDAKDQNMGNVDNDPVEPMSQDIPEPIEPATQFDTTITDATDPGPQANRPGAPGSTMPEPIRPMWLEGEQPSASSGVNQPENLTLADEIQRWDRQPDNADPSWKSLQTPIGNRFERRTTRTGTSWVPELNRSLTPAARQYFSQYQRNHFLPRLSEHTAGRRSGTYQSQSSPQQQQQWPSLQPLQHKHMKLDMEMYSTRG